MGWRVGRRQGGKLRKAQTKVAWAVRNKGGQLQPGRSKTRVVSTLRRLERNWVYTLEWNQQVVDIREQYNLELHETQQIAAGLGLRHPESRK